MRATSGAMTLVMVLAACDGGGATSSPGDAASAAPTTSGATASPAPSPTSEWDAVQRLDSLATEVGEFPADWPRLTLATATETEFWWPNGNEGGPPAVARISTETLQITAMIELGGEEGVFPPDAWGSAPSENGIWVPLAYQKAVALIDTATNTVARRIEVDATPYAVVEDGAALWIADWENSEVIKVDSATGKERLRVPNIMEPTQVAIGSEGLWVNEHAGEVIVRLDAATGDELARVSIGGRPGMTLGLGSVWAYTNDGRTVARIDPATNTIVATIPMPSNPAGVAIAGGAVWVGTGPQRGSCERNSSIVRIDPASNQVDGILDVPCGFGMMAAGSTLWFGRTVGDLATMLRLDAGAPR